jgi:hypothetical protein
MEKIENILPLRIYWHRLFRKTYNKVVFYICKYKALRYGYYRFFFRSSLGEVKKFHPLYNKLNMTLSIYKFM